MPRDAHPKPIHTHDGYGLSISLSAGVAVMPSLAITMIPPLIGFPTAFIPMAIRVPVLAMILIVLPPDTFAQMILRAAIVWLPISLVPCVIPVVIPVPECKRHRWSAVIANCVMVDQSAAHNCRADADSDSFPEMLLFGSCPDQWGHHAKT